VTSHRMPMSHHESAEALPLHCVMGDPCGAGAGVSGRYSFRILRV
jgi:hypothetical protein